VVSGRAAAERESLPAGGGSVAGTPAEEIIVVVTASPGRRQKRMFAPKVAMYKYGDV